MKKQAIFRVGRLPTLFLCLWAIWASYSIHPADFAYTVAKGTITIINSTGFGGAAIIPDRINDLLVTTIVSFACNGHTSLTSVTIPNSVTKIEYQAFCDCTSLTNVTSIGDWAFTRCSSLTGVMIPNSVTSIRGGSFSGCGSLKAVYFQGKAPNVNLPTFDPDNNATVYYLPGTSGWGAAFADCPTALWLPEMQTSDSSLGVRTNQFGFNITWANGKSVVVEASTTLTNPTWSPVSTNTLTSGTYYFGDPQWMNYPARFYRIRTP